MKPYQVQAFTLPDSLPFSQKTLENHLKLYEGYVKNTNLVLQKLEEYGSDPAGNAYVLGELQRRFSFEFDGMRNHEYYFRALEGGPVPLPPDSLLARKIDETWGSFDALLSRLKTVAATRGIGWAMLYHDPVTDNLLTQWVDEQHLGHLTGLFPIVALDMWEHAYLMDFASADKGKYADAYFSAMNWRKANEWYEFSKT